MDLLTVSVLAFCYWSILPILTAGPLVFAIRGNASLGERIGVAFVVAAMWAMSGLYVL